MTDVNLIGTIKRRGDVIKTREKADDENDGDYRFLAEIRAQLSGAPGTR